MGRRLLTDAADAALGLSNEERIALIQEPRFIAYPKAMQILQTLEAMLVGARKERPIGMLLIGEPNNGKSELIKRFVKKHPGDVNLGAEACLRPVLLIQAPPTPSQGSLYESISRLLFQQVRPKATDPEKLIQCLEVLSNVQTKIIIVDECQHAQAGTLQRSRAFLNVLKYLSNELKIHIVLVGTPEADETISRDPQLASRLPLEELNPWDYDGALSGLLNSFEMRLPLRKESNLKSPKLAKLIVTMAGHTIGGIGEVIDRSAILSIRNGDERITADAVKACGYVAAKDRTSAYRQRRRLNASRASGTVA